MRGWYDCERDWLEDLEPERVVELVLMDRHTDACSAAWERGEGCRCDRPGAAPENGGTE